MSNQDLPPKMVAIMEELPTSVSTVLLNCLADKDDTAQRIHEVLVKHNIDISYTTTKAARRAMLEAGKQAA